jgi:LPPG:FO 2-phospho-L-lactate transferase
MITVLSGGTGTPKLLRGLHALVPDEEITVVVNTAEDLWISGNHLSPDIDTVIYLYAGVLNTDTWWGIRGDTFRTHEALAPLSKNEYIAIGDQDRAVHIARGEMLRGGSTLTEATRHLCHSFGVRAQVLPMSDAPVRTMVTTAEGLIHFQEYWIRHHGQIPITDVFRQPNRFEASPAVLEALMGCDAVIIGPSNPVTSIGPILECTWVTDLLKEKPVIAVSPFIGDAPISGPAAALMAASGVEPSSLGTYRLYNEFVDIFVQDVRDPVTVPGAIRYDTLMKDQEKSTALAAEVLSLLKDLS